MSQMFPEKIFRGLKLLLNLIKYIYIYICTIYKEESDKQHVLEADVQYPENLYNLPNDLPFLYEKMKIDKDQKTCS